MSQVFEESLIVAPVESVSGLRLRSRLAAALRARRAAQQEKTQATPAPGIVQVCGAAWEALAAHAPPVLALAAISFVLPAVIGLAVQRIVALDRVRRGEYIFAYYTPVPLAWAIQMALAIVGTTLARGAITRMVMYGERWRAACGATAARWASLLSGSLARAALTVAGAIAIDLLLGGVWLDALHVGARAVTPEGIAHIAAKRSVDAFVLDVSVPVEWVDVRRVNTPFAQHYEKPEAPGHYVASQRLWTPSDRDFWPVVFGGMACLVVAHVLLRFHTAAALGQGAGNPLIALGHCVGVSARHIRCVAIHGIVVRLALCTLVSAFAIVPMAFVRDLALTQALRHTGLDGLRMTCEAAMTLGFALLGCVAWAFEAIYDATLYAALASPSASKGA